MSWSSVACGGGTREPLPPCPAPPWLTPLLPVPLPRLTLVLRFRVWGAAPALRPPWWMSWDSLPAWARAGPSWPSLPLWWTTGLFTSVLRKPSRIIPPCPQFFLHPRVLPFAVRGFPALSVTPGQLRGPRARGSEALAQSRVPGLAQQPPRAARSGAGTAELLSWSGPGFCCPPAGLDWQHAPGAQWTPCPLTWRAGRLGDPRGASRSWVM